MKILFLFLFSVSAFTAENCDMNQQNYSFLEEAFEAVAFENSAIITDQGFDIDSDTCVLGSHRNNLLLDIPRSDERGMSCLNSLAESGGTKARESLQRLRELRLNSISLLCEGSNGEEVFADPESDSIITVPEEYAAWEDSQRQSFLFHEQFHLLGYSHENGPDMADACETCCFGSATPDTQSASCRLCAGGTTP